MLEQNIDVLKKVMKILNDRPEILAYLARDAKARNLVFGHPEKIEKFLDFYYKTVAPQVTKAQEIQWSKIMVLGICGVILYLAIKR